MKEYESAKALKLHFTGMTNRISLLHKILPFVFDVSILITQRVLGVFLDENISVS